MKSRTLLVALAIATLSGAVSAQSVEEFYSGNTITINVPSSAGGTYGLAAQIVAQHMPRHIPGNPAMVLQIMPGGVLATNYMANVAPQDGTYINLLSQSMPDLQASKADGVQFDVLEFHPIGLITGLNGAFVISDTAPTNTLEGLKETEILAGTRERSDYGFITATMLNHFFGTKINVVLGYDGGAESDLAMERGEVHAKFSSWLSVKQRNPEWAQGDGAKIVLQIGATRSSDIPEVPTLVDLAETDDQRALFTFLAGNNTIARGLTAPPGVPEDRVAALREAFEAMVADPEFIADMERQDFPLQPMFWQEYGEVIRAIAETSPEIIVMGQDVLSQY